MAKIRVTIIGCGFVGTALGLAIKNAFKEAEIVGHDKELSAARRAEKLKAIDRSNWNLPAACENAQLIILAIPQDAVELTLKAIAPDIAPGAVVTDTCSLKSAVIDRATELVPAHAAYIGSDIIFAPHHMPASGDIEALTPDVFKGAVWTLTPRPSTESRDIDAIAGLAMALGAAPMFIDATEHDGLRLAVDTLPDLLSSALLLTVTGDEAWRERKWLAGAPFAAGTLQVETMHDGEVTNALLAQPEAAMYWINQVMLRLMALRDAVRDGDANTVKAALSQARDQRAKWLGDWRRGREEGQPGAAVDKPSLLGSLIGSKLASRMQDTQKTPPSSSTKNPK